MTNGEFGKLMKFMKGVYTYTTFANTEEAYEVWRDVFDQFTYNECLAGVKAWISKSSVPPVPADIKEMILKVRTTEGAVGKEPIYKSMHLWGLYDANGVEQNTIYAPTDMSSLDVKQWFSRGGSVEGCSVKLIQAAAY